MAAKNAATTAMTVAVHGVAHKATAASAAAVVLAAVALVATVLKDVQLHVLNAVNNLVLMRLALTRAKTVAVMCALNSAPTAWKAAALMAAPAAKVVLAPPVRKAASKISLIAADPAAAQATNSHAVLSLWVQAASSRTPLAAHLSATLAPRS